MDDHKNADFGHVWLHLGGPNAEASHKTKKMLPRFLDYRIPVRRAQFTGHPGTARWYIWETETGWWFARARTPEEAASGPYPSEQTVKALVAMIIDSNKEMT